MKYRVFVDNSNVWIEGKYVSAVHEGSAKNIREAHDKRIQNNNWHIDFGRLLNIVADNEPENIVQAMLFGSKPPQKDSLWKAAKKTGFDVITHDRNYFGKEKKVDTAIVTEIMRVLYTESQEDDHFVLVMGDADFIPAINAIHNRQLKVTVAFWGHAASEMKSAPDRFINLDSKIDALDPSLPV